MIHSREKQEDIEFRTQLLELMEFSLRMFKETKDNLYWNHAIEFGETSSKIKEFIDRVDYSKRDEARRRIERSINFRVT